MRKSLVITFILFLVISSVYGQKLKPEEIIAKHLSSIASTEKLSSVKSLIAVGEVRVEYLTQKNQPAIGRIVIASEGNKLFFGMQLNATDYPQEKVIFDGSKTDVAAVRAGSRSIFGNFVQSNNSIVSQGLMLGTLATSWALLDAAQRGAKISSGGTKKTDGKEAYALNFSPKGSSDLDITMFFDAQTLQHIRTEYKRTASASMGRTIDESARQQETRMKVTEDFSEFREVQGMNLPSRYKIHYSISGQNGTTEIAWTANLSEFAVNQPLDPGTFAIGK